MPSKTFDGATYLAPALYDSIISAVLKAQPSICTGTIDRDALMIALGEQADVWPETTLIPALDERLAEMGLKAPPGVEAV